MSFHENKTDRRVVRTRNAIKNAFISLISCKALDEITVKEVADMADINRKTFYAHYPSVSAIFCDLEDELIDSMLALLDESDFGTSLFDPLKIFEKLTQLIKENQEFCQYLHEDSAYGLQLMEKLNGTLRSQTLAKLQPIAGVELRKLETAVDFTVAGALAVFGQWLKSDSDQSLQILSEDVMTLATRGIWGFFETAEKDAQSPPVDHSVTE